MKATKLVLLVLLTALAASCGGLLGLGGVPTPSPAQGGARGRLAIELPSASPKAAIALVSALAGTSRSLEGRAFLFATRAELELRNAQGILVDAWTCGASTEALPSASADTSRSVVAGSGYSLKARIFNDAVSATLPVVTGEVGGITVASGAETRVSLPCIPNPAFTTDLVPGSPATGSLACAVVSGPSMTASLVSTGGEAWFRITPGTGKNRIDLTIASPDPVGGYISLFNSDGTWMGRDAAFLGSGQTVVLGAPVSDSAYYYVGIVLASLGTPASATFSLSLAESVSTTIGDELLANGDFSAGTSGWGLYTSGAGSATMNVVDAASPPGDKELKIAIAVGGSWLNGELVFYQRGISLEAGKTYRLTWQGRGSAGNPAFYISLGDYGGALGLGDPQGSMTTYGMYAETGRTLEKTSEYSFFVSGPSTTNAYLIFQPGASDVVDTDVYLDDLSLVEIQPPFPAPASFTGSQSGRSLELSWAPVPGADDYVVSRRGPEGGPNFNIVYTGSATTCTVGGHWYGHPYEYRVVARSGAGTGTPAQATLTLTGKPVSGTIKNTGLDAGSYDLIITDSARSTLVMKGSVTLDADGAGSFSLAGGEPIPASARVEFTAYLDKVLGSMKTGQLSPGDPVSKPVNFSYDTAADDGTITDMRLWEWSSAASLPVLGYASREAAADTVQLSWWDLWNRAASAVLVQRSPALAGPYTTVAVTNPQGYLTGSGDEVFKVRSCTDTTATNGQRWYYRIGIDTNSNGQLDPGEYAADCHTEDAAPSGTLSVGFE